MDYFKSNWFKIIMTIFIGEFLLTLTKKMLKMNISLGVTDFLSIVLALFSIGLSVAFYFKSTDQSNKFYDDTTKFTKDTGMLLGEIKASFGEKLAHLSQENIVIRNSIEGVKGAISQKENRVHTDREELNTVLSAISLLEQQKSNAKPDDTEQYEKTINDLKKTVNNKETEIAQLQNDLEELKNKKKQALKSQHITPIIPIKEDYAIITCDVCKHTIGLASSYIKNTSFTKDGALHTYCPDCATATKVIY
ncbi:hypothetical protein [Bacillus thuringiensis]|uniref:hypothetical protein n=1 Tax=Bacillus thuringiensis TaxID=1428 RepID=UPI00207A8239|nr:hypothetical protein [Bacillus thuringiensis]USL15775.1 hypothetical protein LIT28_11420 [Bacillus thuringiensis]